MLSQAVPGAFKARAEEMRLRVPKVQPDECPARLGIVNRTLLAEKVWKTDGAIRPGWDSRCSSIEVAEVAARRQLLLKPA